MALNIVDDVYLFAFAAFGLLLYAGDDSPRAAPRSDHVLVENKPMKRRQKSTSSVNNKKQEEIPQGNDPRPLPLSARKADRII
jgi:hypothetical protein